ncbi:ABC transporter substrate-binding protein [Cryptosporangium aurantiacum]|uniref:Branched-chain amino acid transport system substrate-binding protein n=1 Tax=Cryptosporangium aurantiacum TaxID=134849 RepID=A0A1M7PM88_9ACTN|nr:ABC transporter substrate-binding protein [Cryptosporangium aurantiacum]SHN18179.1 branched-chain amino acid transport system substrate-binding protein [Cryptosporangium aurantiacum]
MPAAHRRARFGLPAVLLAVALAATACADSGSGSDDPTPGAEALGPEKAAAGAPVKIGWVGTGRTQTVDTTDEQKAAEAAAEYANKHLGGLGGRPIELVTCEAKESPADAQVCGNKFVTEKVSAVTAGTSSQVDPWVKIVNAAGIPVGINFASTQVVLSTPGVFIWANPVAAYGTPAAYAKQEKLSSAAIIVIDVPAASGPAKTLGPALFKNAGATADVVAIAPGTADMTPQIQAAQNKKPEMYFVLGDPTFCGSAIKAIKTLGITQPVLALDRCIGNDKGASIPGGFTDIKIVTQAVTEPGDAEYKLFQAVLSAYGDGTAVSSQAISGYQGLLSLVRTVNASGSKDLSPEGVRKAIAAAPATNYPLGGGATLKCDGKALPAVSPNLCSTVGVIADAAQDGALSNFTVPDSTGIYQLG